ncbi:lysine transporter [Alteromonas sp. KS69]|jgi:L-lysine exporter family protein LysE/ArgO|uniref:LysE/ArgO family amino acid transporter n=1 Tax=unclassified Alteromonas TaxID=2614992 RepID=UPI000C0EA7BF|nr:MULTISPECIES: LysE family transporter [unclassified Alteromonas]MBB67187.1 lysine transporter [Rickettsiales bacterium]MBO7921959.1 LysE family transporter [Alteromonas sp. K632G]PHS50476.1 MAG: lysine transporter [Alteromonas sp.]RUP80772.1 lysine transporter [Alteromonas sp. KS69]|tara:strand:+ start:92078 stop:92680 length:603 start_codon:yes stop_codon:yes gene_type:complete
MFAAALSGFVMGGTLIIAVGAQNSFLIEQSLKRQWTGLFVLLFIVSDAISISLGAMGFGLLLQEYPLLVSVTKWAGVIFLLWFAFNKLKASMADDALVLEMSKKQTSFKRAFLIAMAVTWLNPHFYLDTLLLMGNLASQWQLNKWWFVLGAVWASIVWFVGLSTLTAKFAHHMQRPSFWRWFNRLNAAVLGAVSIQLASL